MKYFNSNISIYYSILILLISCNLINASSVTRLEADIQKDYKQFTGYKIPNLKVQPCSAVQFVYFLQTRLEQKNDRETADKIRLIIMKGSGVGGISKRIATEDEKKVLFGAIYNSSLYFADEADVKQNSLISAHELTVQLAYITSKELNKKRSIGSVLRNFVEDLNSYNTFINALTKTFKQQEQIPLKNISDKLEPKVSNSSSSIKEIIKPVNPIEDNNNSLNKTVPFQQSFPDFTTYISNFKNIEEDKIEKWFKNATDQMNANLSRRGYGKNSTAQQQSLSQLEFQRIQANQQIEIQTKIYETMIKNAYLDQLNKERVLREIIQQHYQFAIQQSPTLLSYYQEESKKKLLDIIDFQAFIEIFTENRLKAINESFENSRHSSNNRGIYEREYQNCLFNYQFEAHKETKVEAVWEAIQTRNNYLLLKINEYKI